VSARIVPGDWEGLEAAIRAFRACGGPRTDLEETLLQATLFSGFPRAVSAFAVLEREWPAAEVHGGGSPPLEQRASAGRALFDAIYAENAPAVHAMLRRYHPDFHAFVLEAAYGGILARPAVDPRTRELLAVGSLAALDQVPQLVAHARGARRFGATREQVAECLFTALGDDAVVADHMRRIG